jgi:hypothetical protein
VNGLESGLESGWPVEYGVVTGQAQYIEQSWQDAVLVEGILNK